MALQEDSACFQLELLPDAILKHVMTFVPLSIRLGTCSMVSQRFYRAATTATCSVTASTTSSSLLPWLNKHGQFVTSLKLSTNLYRYSPSILPPLPCPRLRHLDLSCCCVNMGVSSNLLATCTTLTYLNYEASIRKDSSKT